MVAGDGMYLTKMIGIGVQLGKALRRQFECSKTITANMVKSKIEATWLELKSGWIKTSGLI